MSKVLREGIWNPSASPLDLALHAQCRCNDSVSVPFTFRLNNDVYMYNKPHYFFTAGPHDN